MSLSHVNVNIDKIVDIIQKYSPNKANGCDQISVAMLKICATEVALPLSLIFQSCLSTGTFPESWKCANVQPIHKKITVKLNQITGLYHFYLYVENF